MINLLECLVINSCCARNSIRSYFNNLREENIWHSKIASAFVGNHPIRLPACVQQCMTLQNSPHTARGIYKVYVSVVLSDPQYSRHWGWSFNEGITLDQLDQFCIGNLWQLLVNLLEFVSHTFEIWVQLACIFYHTGSCTWIDNTLYKYCLILCL